MNIAQQKTPETKHFRCYFCSEKRIFRHCVVEARGVEPLSEILSSEASPGAVNGWSIPLSPSSLTSAGGPVAYYTNPGLGIHGFVILFNLPTSKVCYLTPGTHPADRMA